MKGGQRERRGAKGSEGSKGGEGERRVVKGSEGSEGGAKGSEGGRRGVKGSEAYSILGFRVPTTCEYKKFDYHV